MQNTAVFQFWNKGHGRLDKGFGLFPVIRHFQKWTIAFTAMREVIRKAKPDDAAADDQNS